MIKLIEQLKDVYEKEYSPDDVQFEESGIKHTPVDTIYLEVRYKPDVWGGEEFAPGQRVIVKYDKLPDLNGVLEWVGQIIEDDYNWLAELDLVTLFRWETPQEIRGYFRWLLLTDMELDSEYLHVRLVERDPLRNRWVRRTT